MRILSCLFYEHNLLTVLLAGVICILGCHVGMRLFKRTFDSDGLIRASWSFLAAMCLSASIWATHFVAMLGYQPDTHVTLDPALTALSAIIILSGSGFAVAVASIGRAWLRVFSGAVLGLAIAAMHFIGMFAYRVEGVVIWSSVYIIASIAMAVIGGAAAVYLSGRSARGWHAALPAITLMLAVIALHFTGMAAFQVVPMENVGGALDSGAFFALAFAITVASLLVVGAGAAGSIIESALSVRAHDAMERMSLRDAVTGLPNRVGYAALLEKRLASRERDDRIVVLTMDLQRFQAINDRYGHHGGDAVLVEIAKRLKWYDRSIAPAGRIDGDEFALAVAVGGELDIQKALVEFQEKMTAPFQLGDTVLQIDFWIGAAVCPDDGRDGATLLRNATLARHKAKSDKISACFYDKNIGETVRKQRELVNALSRAIEYGPLDVHYQPQIEIGTGRISGYEALVRWTRASGETVSPAEFIPIAEANGMVGALGAFVLRRVCEEAARWMEPSKVAVNVSAVQLEDPNFAETILEALINSGLPASRLEIELTETALIKDLQHSLSILHRIKALGVSIALDDFGVGYSSLETLRRFAFDKIKLDKSFADGLADGGRTEAVISSVVTLSRLLKTPVLAEGVETAAQLQRLHALGCDQAQGYLIGHPAALADGAPPQPSGLLDERIRANRAG